MKRRLRRRLKEDELVTTFTKVLRFARKRSREITAAAVAVVVIILIIVGIRFAKAQSIKKESRLLGQILELHANLEQNPENISKLEEIAGKGKFSRLAYLLLANHWVENGNLDKAEESLLSISAERKDLFYYQAQDLLAQIQMKKGDFDKAIAIYERVRKDNPEEYAMDAVLFHQAEAFEKRGDIQKALALYRKIQEEYPQTFFGYDASQKVQKLEAKK